MCREAGKPGVLQVLILKNLELDLNSTKATCGLALSGFLASLLLVKDTQQHGAWLPLLNLPILLTAREALVFSASGVY